MKNIIFILMFAFSQVSQADQKAVDKAAEVATAAAPIELPAEAKQALIRWNFKFKRFNIEDYSPEVRELFEEPKQHPATQSADYNGDSINDYALLGAAGEQQYAIALVSGKDQSWKVIQLKHWSIKNIKQSKVPGVEKAGTGVPFYLTKADGDAAAKFEKEKKRAAIQLEAYLGAVELFGIENDKPLPIDTK